MRKPFVVSILSVVVMLAAMSAAPAFADVAPPQQPPGADIKNGQPDTKVQMVSENVLMTVADYQPTAEQKQSFVAPFARGHVDATFIMQNQSDAAESFDVWFPIGADTGMGKVATVDNFTAYVDGVQAANIGQQMTQGQFDQQVPWATWPATFPPGKQVTLRVTYDTFPTGYAPYGRFEYILETGAGWNGPIGDGTVTIRLPYQVNELNAATKDNKDYYSPKGGPFTVSGTDVVWHFTNLEPTADNNIDLTVLAPGVWMGIQAAQAAAQASPESARAQLDLGNALTKGLEWKYGLIPIGSSPKLRDMAVTAYEKALALDPNNVDVYTGYLGLLDSENSVMGIPDTRYVQLLDRALQLAPDNQQFQTMKQNLSFNLTQLATLGTTVPPAPTLTVAPPAAPTATVAVAVAVVSPTPAPELTQPPADASTSIAAPPPAAAPGGITPGGVGLVIVGIIVLGIVLIAVALIVGMWLGRRSKT